MLASVEAINGTDVLPMLPMLEPRYYFGFAAFGGRPLPRAAAARAWAR